MINTAFIVFFALVGIIFLLGEALLKYLKENPEVTRRFTHLLGGLLVFVIPSYLTLGQAVALGILVATVLAISESFKLLPSVTRVERSTLGSILFPLGLVASGLLFWESNLTAFRLSVLVLSISDSVAGFIGYGFGKRKFLSVTFEGSGVFLLITLAIFISFGVVLGE